MKQDFTSTNISGNPNLNHWVIGAGLIGGCFFFLVIILAWLLFQGNAVWDFKNPVVGVPLLILLGAIPVSVVLPKIIQTNSIQKSREEISQPHDTSSKDDLLRKRARQISLSKLIARLAPVEGAAFAAVLFAFITNNFVPFLVAGAAIA